MTWQQVSCLTLFQSDLPNWKHCMQHADVCFHADTNTPRTAKDPLCIVLWRPMNMHRCQRFISTPVKLWPLMRKRTLPPLSMSCDSWREGEMERPKRRFFQGRVLCSCMHVAAAVACKDVSGIWKCPHWLQCVCVYVCVLRSEAKQTHSPWVTLLPDTVIAYLTVLVSILGVLSWAHLHL